MKKHINIVILVLIILNALTIYFVFAKPPIKQADFLFDNDSFVKDMEIEYTVMGNPLAKIEVTELNDKETNINKVATNMGFAFDISGNFSNIQLREAEITLTYNDKKLEDGFNEENLGILWYDEKNQKMETVKSKVNVEDNTISFKTTHFSQYVIVDIEAWNAIWEKELPKIRKGDESFNVALLIDDSGSMAENDRNNQRITASQETVYLLSDKDMFSIIAFDTSVDVLQDFTKDKSNITETLKNFDSSGGTNIVDAVEQAIENISKLNNNGYNIIMLLTDGEDSNLKSQKDSLVQKAKEKNITIYALGVQATDATDNINYQPLQELAEATGGKFYSIANTQIGEAIDDMAITHIGIDPSVDSDNDGLPDKLETEGFLDRWGNIYVTSPTEADTDGDGISDKDEVGKLIDDAYYELPSNPTEGSAKKEDYDLGPTNNPANEKHDSGFRPNINALPIRNFKLNGQGQCAGFAILTEKVYNQTIKHENGIYGTYLAEEDFGKIIAERKLYMYVPLSDKLKPGKTYDEIKDKLNIESSETFIDRDFELIGEIKYLFDNQSRNRFFWIFMGQNAVCIDGRYYN